MHGAVRPAAAFARWPWWSRQRACNGARSPAGCDGAECLVDGEELRIEELRPAPHTWGSTVSVLRRGAAARRRVARAERSRSRISSGASPSLSLACRRRAKLA